MAPEPRPSDGEEEFILNEPTTQVPDGSRRVSEIVDRSDLPMIRRRERLNELLLAHDPEVAESHLAQLTDEDVPLLRQIAREGALTGVEPVLRRNAIAALCRFPTPENVNLLEELARYGEDHYVRSAALMSLGKTGLILAGPILRDGLEARERVEQVAAERALTELGRHVGESPIRELFAGEKRKESLARLERILDVMSAPRSRAVPAQRRRSSGRPGKR